MSKKSVRSKNVKQDSRGSKWRKRVIIVIAVLLSPIILLASVFLIRLLYSIIASDIQTRNTPSEVKVAYENSREKFGGHISFEQDLAASGVVKEKIGETRTSVCYIQTDGGGGWTIAGYSQVCYLRVTSGYYTDMTKLQALNALSHSTQRRYFSSDRLDTFPHDCEFTDYDSPALVRYVDRNSQPSSVDVYGFLDYEECGRPSAVQGLSSVSGRTYEADLSIKKLVTLSPTPSNERNQIWLEKDYQYFDQSIVCKPVLIPILSDCDLSRKQPVQ